jgi:alpha-2-macroglobulin
MRIKLLIATTLVVAIFLSACNRDFVALDYTNARGEVPQLHNLVFRFNKPLVTDSLLNFWDSTEYVTFQPHIEGRFRWEAPDQLVFSPSRPLDPATSYTVKIQNDVLRYSQYDKVQNDKEISFHTAPLQLSNAEVTWVLQDESSRMAVPQVVLQFNYPVKPEELKDKLSIDVDAKKTEYTLQTLSSSNEVAVRLNGFKGEDRNYEAQVKIEKGLFPQGGRNATDQPIQTLLTIPSPYVLNINSVESEHDGTEGIVRLSTSQQLRGDNITSYIKFEPAVSYTVEYNHTGITLRSDKFSAEESYALTIAKGLRGRIGGVLKENYNESVAFGQLEPGIRFTNSKAVYLSKQGGGNIEVKITNVPKVRLVISKIYENNLLMAPRIGYYPPDEQREAEYASYAETGEYGSYSEALAGDVIYTKEIDTRSLKKSGGGRVLNLSQFSDRLPDLKGIYHVQLRSANNYWVQDSRFISLSDIGLIARQGQDKLFVFTNSIKTAGALDGVTVKVYGNNNQLMGSGATNKDGVAEIAITKRPFAGFKPAMVIATTADDFTYLPFNNTLVNTSRFDVGGKRSNATGLDAFIYPERDIYRPGERIHFSVLLRDRQWKSPGEIPVKLKVLLPNGKELKAFRKTLNEQGSLEGSVDISTAAITGSYLLEVYSSNDVLLSSKNIMIEEFVPDRIKVTTKLNKPSFQPGEEAVLSINAVNFFGPPAAHRNYETEIQVKQKEFTAKNFSDYDFALANQKTFFDKEVQEGTTDDNGNATGTFTVPKMYTNIGLLQANFYTTVFDETGRPVSRLASTPVYTQDVFHGVKDDGYYYYPLNQRVSFKLVSANIDGAADRWCCGDRHRPRKGDQARVPYGAVQKRKLFPLQLPEGR